MGLTLPQVGRRGLRLLLAVALLPIGAVLICLVFLPWPLALRWTNPGTTSFMEHRLREARKEGRDLEIRQVWISLERISPNLRRAVLAAEDDRFYFHRGIDWRAVGEEVGYDGDTAFSWWDAADRRALREALAYAWEHKSEIKGRSTLTQQLAKNLYFTPDRSLARKLAEAIVAKCLELLLTKDRILEIYLNVAEWGPGIFGAEAAAQAYFERGADDLTLEQAVTLAATLPHPLTSNPAFRPARMEWRKTHILRRLENPPIPSPDPIEMPSIRDTIAVWSDTTSPRDAWIESRTLGHSVVRLHFRGLTPGR